MRWAEIIENIYRNFCISQNFSQKNTEKSSLVNPEKDATRGTVKGFPSIAGCTIAHCWEGQPAIDGKKRGSQDPGSFDFFGQN